MKSVSMKQRLAGKKSLKIKWMQKEYVSKQGRKPAKAEPTMHKDPVFDDLNDIVDAAMDYMESEDAQDEGRTRYVVLEEKESTQKGVSSEVEVSTVKQDEGTDKPKVSTDKPEVSTTKPKELEVSTDKLDEGTAEPKDGTSDESTAPTTVFRDNETIAEFLVSMSQNKAKQKGVEIKDVEDSDRPRDTSTRLVLTLKPLPKIDPKYKGKKVLEEEAESGAESEGVDEAERKFDQLAKDEEIARKVQEDWEAEKEMKKLAKEKATKAALIQDFDDIQAKIEADILLAARLQEEERETFTVEERAKFLYDTIAAQRRFLGQQRGVAIRSKPPTRTQLRNQMMTYLKHVGGKKHADLKNKNFKEIQVLKDPKKKRVVNETPREEDTAKVPAEQEVTEQGIKKRKSGHVKMIARKIPRLHPDDDSDDEHRKCLRIVTFKSTIDSEIMETKSFISKLHKVSSPDGDYLVVYRVNGHFRAFNYLLEVLHIFDRQDLFHLYDLVMKQYSEITPEGIELILWGDLKIMIESSTEENDQVIHMLVERMYPLSKEFLQRMLDLRLAVVEEIRRVWVLANHYTTNGLQFTMSNKQKQTDSVKSWLVQDQTVPVQKQTAFGKDKSNLLIVDSLLKTIRLSIHLVVYNEELAIPEQTATGKGISNPLMAVVENMDGYRDQDMGDIILGESFCKASCVEARRFDGLITIYNGSDNVTYQMARSHLKFKHLFNVQCNKIKPLLKVSMHDKLNGISHPYQKLKSFYKGVLNLGPEYIRDAKMEEWLTRGHVSLGVFQFMDMAYWSPDLTGKEIDKVDLNASISGKEGDLEFMVWKQVLYHGDDEVVEDKERPMKKRRVNDDEMYEAANEE
ncbi:hypothetical protein Tco_1200993 [Tanacetum coccineum]